MSARRAVIIDCDPGHDDALAILLALGSPDDLEVIAITTVAGNAPLALTEKNARKVVELAGRPDLAVYAGSTRPLIRPLTTAAHVHGETGLDGPDLPEPVIALAQGHAVDAIVDLVQRRPPGTVTLCPIGPLTNVALAILKAPEIASRLREIVLMGGAIGLGNITPAAEFNIYVDPHAAKVVFESGAPIVMHGLDVTRQALVTPARLDAIRAIGTPVAIAAAELLAFYGGQHPEGPAPLHDPCAVAWLLRPGLFAGHHCHVAIETTGEHTLGRTVVDWSGRTGHPPNALVIDRIDGDGFFQLLTGRLARLTGS